MILINYGRLIWKVNTTNDEVVKIEFTALLSREEINRRLDKGAMLLGITNAFLVF